MNQARAILTAALVFTGGCVYYNGMYNAKRMANEAEKAEQQGRRFEAQNYWAQAEIKADSVISRHPNSSWADDALLIKGTALVKRNACREAVPPLEQVLFSSTDQELIDEANFLIGSCFYQMGEPLTAERYLEIATASEDSSLAVAARSLYGSTLNRLGRYQEAMEVLGESTEPEWDWERAVALAGSGYLGRSLSLADTLIARRDTFVVWDTVLVVVAAVDLESASTLTDLLVAADSVGSRSPARYRLADGRRWADVNQSRAILILEAAAEDSFAANSDAFAARIEWTLLELSRVRTGEELPAVALVLQPATVGGGAASLRARRLAASIEGVATAIDSIDYGKPNGDLDVFLTAEAARDTLVAPILARSLFQQLYEGWPDSPYVPKAILAMALLDRDNAGTYYQSILYLYPQSPYLQFIDGVSTPAYRALEDSLRVYAFARTGRTAPAQGGRQRRGQRANDLNPEDEDP
jgi:tetratricopeptide (TPR) repeat protein